MNKLIELPINIVFHIFNYLDKTSKINMRQINHIYFKALSKFFVYKMNFQEYENIKLVNATIPIKYDITCYNISDVIKLKNVHILRFGNQFNNIIEKLPEELVGLHFGHHFNQKIEPNVLPKKLRSITFGWHFNQELKPDVLPNSLHDITFGNSFEQELKPNVLPKKLRSITLVGVSIKN